MKCVHLSKHPNQTQVDVTIESTGETHTLCMACFEIFKNDPRNNPLESVGYNIYCSLDPKLPKNEWTKVNDSPIPPTESGRIQYCAPAHKFVDGSNYYFYAAAVNTIGIEGFPSKVVKGQGSDNVDLPVF